MFIFYALYYAIFFKSVPQVFFNKKLLCIHVFADYVLLFINFYFRKDTKYFLILDIGWVLKHAELVQFFGALFV